MATKNIPEIDDLIRNYGAKVKETAGKTQIFIDDEIRKTIIGATATSDFQQKSGEDILSDLNDVICKMTTLIMCSPKNKELLEKMEGELPHMKKIFPNPYLGDDKLYVITDEELKKSMLEFIEIVKGDVEIER